MQSEITNDVLTSVSDKIKAAAPIVKDRLKNLLVERELENRVDTLDKALLKAKDLKKEFDKIRPDTVAFDATGLKLESYSKDVWEKRKKASDAMENLNKAIETALLAEVPDAFAKLRDLLK